MVQAFDGRTERGRNCKLTLHVHATDFDDTHSGERIEWIQVNGATVNQDCFPAAYGCMEGVKEPPMFACKGREVLATSIVGSGKLKLGASTMLLFVNDVCIYFNLQENRCLLFS